jgi:Flp pilus assembly protein TadG
MRRRLQRDERGSLAPAVPVIAFMLLLLGGLGIDGSRQLNARGEAVAYAEEASRAGAQSVDVTADDLTLLPTGDVKERVDKYCAAILKQEAVTDCRFVRIERVSESDPRMLVVVTHVTMSIKPSLLGLVWQKNLTASAFARARPYEGIDTALR